MIEPFSFTDYEKLSDDLCILTRNCVVRFNVTLGYKGKDNTKIDFHKEYCYPSKYLDRTEGITMRRNFKYYISIELRDNYQAGVMINLKDMLFLQSQLRDSITWFGTLYKRTRNHKMIIKGEYRPIKIGNLFGGKYLELEPTIIDYNEDTQVEGIRMYFSSHNIYEDIDIDTYMGFVYLMTNFNMYDAASNMLAYMNNVEFGKYIIRMDVEDNLYDKKLEYESTTFNDRKIKELQKNKAGRSFFDKMKDLEDD